MGKPLNLDALRAPSNRVIFLGVEYEIGYLPAAVELPLIECYNAMVQEQKQARERGKRLSPEKVTEDNIALVASFCSYYDPAVTADVIAKEATGREVLAMVSLLVQAIVSNNKLAEQDTRRSDNKKKMNGGIFSIFSRGKRTRVKPTSCETTLSSP